MNISPDGIARWIAAGFGSGWLPKAPGTWGSLACLFPAWFIWQAFGSIGLWCGVIFFLLLGCGVCALVLSHAQDTDPGWIVVDEWAGQFLILAVITDIIPLNPLWFITAFAAFRLFDIWKPWPVSVLEHTGPAWWAIMADDLMAGLFGGMLLVGVHTLWVL